MSLLPFGSVRPPNFLIVWLSGGLQLFCDFGYLWVFSLDLVKHWDVIILLEMLAK